MRIRIIREPSTRDVDGIDLQYFQLGSVYDVGYRLAELFLAEQWAEPLPFDAGQRSEPDAEPLSFPTSNGTRRPTLAKAYHPPYRYRAIAADSLRRRPRRRHSR